MQRFTVYGSSPKVAPVRQIAAAAVTRIFAPVPRLPMEVTFLPVINQFRKPYLNRIPQFHFDSPLLFLIAPLPAYIICKKIISLF